MDYYYIMSLLSVVVLIVVACTGVVYGGCTEHEFCDNPVEILNSIKAYPENNQQLLNAFYPINHAIPSSVIIVYFTNYTEPLPKECSQGTYPWRTFPTINYTYHDIHWYMWTTTPIYSVGGQMLLREFGEYLPTISYYLTFNKSSPFTLPTQIACIKVPYSVSTKSIILGDVTTQVSKQFKNITFQF